MKFPFTVSRWKQKYQRQISQNINKLHYNCLMLDNIGTKLEFIYLFFGKLTFFFFLPKQKYSNQTLLKHEIKVLSAFKTSGKRVVSPGKETVKERLIYCAHFNFLTRKERKKASERSYGRALSRSSTPLLLSHSLE